MSSVYPHPNGRPSGAEARVNEFIHRHMTDALSGSLESENTLPAAHARASVRAVRLIDGLTDIGVEKERITTVIAIAHIDFLKQYVPPPETVDA